MKKLNISDAELEVLKEFWEESPLSSRRLVDRLQTRTAWGEPTIKTLLLRLLRKKALKRKAQGKSFLYYAVIGREEYQYEVGRSMLDRVFGGTAGNFLTCLVNKGNLRKEELEEMRKLLEKASEKEETPT